MVSGYAKMVTACASNFELHSGSSAVLSTNFTVSDFNTNHELIDTFANCEPAVVFHSCYSTLDCWHSKAMPKFWFRSMPPEQAVCQSGLERKTAPVKMFRKKVVTVLWWKKSQ